MARCYEGMGIQKDQDHARAIGTKDTGKSCQATEARANSTSKIKDQSKRSQKKICTPQKAQSDNSNEGDTRTMFPTTAAHLLMISAMMRACAIVLMQLTSEGTSNLLDPGLAPLLKR